MTFGNYFNQRVDNLPKNITHLTFGDNFNQPVDNLPKNITHLILRQTFSQLVDNLPNTIVELSCGFSSKIKLPHCLKKLIITTEYWMVNRILKKMKIPHTVTEIIVKKDFLPFLEDISKTCIITEPF